jgi:lysophospholipase L1-like esterase
VRRLLQERFGDAGHGFVLIARPWAWYGHNGIKLQATGWDIAAASQKRAADGIHGLGGVSFRGQTGASSTISLPDDGYSSVTIHFLAQPGGGTFAVYASDRKLAEVSTATETRAETKTETKPATKQMAFEQLPLPAGSRNIELKVTSGTVRLFGYRFDKDQPGVQYSSLGINGAQVQMLFRYFEPGQWSEALRHENPALVVLNYGTNESIYPDYVEKQYPNELRQVIARVRAALPHASILLMAPMDRGVMNSSGDIATPEALDRLVAVQKKVAGETGCAFFNTYAAMGGAGTMGRWYHAQPRLVSADFMHPLPAGAAKVGALFEEALVKSYDESSYAGPPYAGQQ